jgi:hypothetical protein
MSGSEQSQSASIEFWKIAPGEHGSDWEACREGKLIAIGWEELGDLSSLSQEDFDEKAEAILRENPTWGKRGLFQAWTFSRIPIGSMIVANRGTTEVLGFGRITGPYTYVPGHHAHRLPVEWIDVRPRVVEQPGWRRTLVRLTQQDFNELLTAAEVPVENEEELPGETVSATDLRGYRLPLLEILREGGASKRDVIERVFTKVDKFLLPGDRRLMPSGTVLWKHRASWALSYLKDEGNLQNPRQGFWEITDAGRQYIAGIPNWSLAEYQKGSQARVRLDGEEPTERAPIKVVARTQPNIRFKEVPYQVEHLLMDIERGDIALPDIQRPFVWKTVKVRDLFDSMYCGFPVGSLMLWSTIESTSVRKIGVEEKQRAASHLVIDGQQRLTSLYSVMCGKSVRNENFEEVRLEIAFRPADGRFEVADAAIRKNPEFISDISELWTKKTTAHRAVKEFVERLKTKRSLTADDEDAITTNLDRLLELKRYRFTTLEIDRDVDEEAVADIFVRINNGGSKLGQSDFILTLLSVFAPETRRALEDFARSATTPSSRGEPSPFNYLIQPKPDQLVRVAIALGFHRARLSSVYQLLRGKDPETGTLSSALREGLFKKLEQSVEQVLDLKHWHLFIGYVVGAGFRGGDLISSETALLYSYALYLIGKIQCGVDEKSLGRLMARWFFASSLTARYSSASETVMEEDLSLVRDLHEPAPFVQALEQAMDRVLTNDFWQITMPLDLETSSVNSPTARAYQVAQVKLGAPVLFSDRQLSQLRDPLITSKRKAIESHHLFPKAFLKSIDVTDTKRINQAANLAYVEWPDNVEVSDASPAEYVPKLRAQFSQETWDAMCSMHALPPSWETLGYGEFLRQRQKLMASLIRTAFETLSGKEVRPLNARSTASEDEKTTWSLIERVEVELRKLVRALYAEKWGAGAEGRLRKIFSEKEIASLESRKQKHLESYPLAPGQIASGDFLDYLYLSDLARLVTAQETWDKFSPIFDKRKELLQGKLEQIAPVRNDRAHFRAVPENELLRCKLACNDLLTIFGRHQAAPVARPEE